MFRRNYRSPSFTADYPSAREIAARLKGETRPDGSGNYSLPLPRPHAQERRRQSFAQRQGWRERATAPLCHAGCDFRDIVAALKRQGILPRRGQ